MNSFDYNGLKISWLGHASILIEGSKTIFIDPWELNNSEPKADFILVTHEHHDHFSPEDIELISQPATKVISSRQVCEQIDNCKVLTPYEETNFEEVKISGFPAYNKNKFRSPGVPFHPKPDEKLGYIIEMDDTRFYIAGDTDFLNQMRELKVDIAFIPVGGTYTMDPKEAASAVNSFKPKIAIPVHWGRVAGSRESAEEFARLAEVEVKILQSPESTV